MVQTGELPALDTTSQVKSWFKRLYDGIMGVRPFARLQPYSEGGEDGRIYREVDSALTGVTATAERVDDQQQAGAVGGGADAGRHAPSMACCWFPPKAATLTTYCARNAPP